MKKYIYLILISAFFSISCSDFLKEYSQDLAYVRGYEDLDELLLGEVYMDRFPVSYYLNSNGTPVVGGGVSSSQRSYYPYIHYIADELEVITTGNGYNPGYMPYKNFIGYFTWQQLPKLGQENVVVWEENDWVKMYRHINVANMVIAELGKLKANDNGDEMTKERIKGEALFNRAANFFVLVNLYAEPYATTKASQTPGIPLKLDENVEKGQFARSSVASVYDQIIKDLTQSAELLKGKTRHSMYRADYASACLLLSRTYLYMQDYPNAMKWAEMTIKNAPEMVNLNVPAGMTQFLSSQNKEIFFSMGAGLVGNDILTDEKLRFTAESGQIGLSTELMNMYTDKDLRIPFFAAKKKGQYDHLERNSYRKQFTTGTTSDVSDHFVLRTSEAYLNLAEAAACNNEPEKAREAVKALRDRRLSVSEAITLSGEELVQFIRDERRRELCLEGHRWFDLRRYMVNSNYPYSKTLTNRTLIMENYAVKGYNEFDLLPNDAAWTMPIPDEEVVFNGFPNNIRNPRPPRNI